ncbi:MAG: hypothetical protein ABI661_03165, partial [Gammaproteobacteria bacterium]
MKMMPKIPTRWPAVGAALLCFTATEATTLDDVGYTQLQAELGLATPVGAGVLISQIEGNQLMDPDYAYVPETGNAELMGKTITDVSALSTAPSGHATAVAQLFYGNTMASARGITNITGYLADHWLQTGYLHVEDSNPTAPWPVQSARRVANHSYIGGYPGDEGPANNANALRRVDWLVERDDYLQVVAYAAVGPAPLLSSAFNVISADWTGALPTIGSAAVDAIYTAGRTRPDVVAPIDSPSQATPIVASAAALLVGVGQSSSALSTDLSAISTTNRNGDTIYNASRSEVIKAALMAGAARFTRNSTGADITDYRANAADRTTNGLDRRYGAGQVNVRNSYWIIASGEKNSTEDGGPGSGSATQGFDFDPHFGGTASNSQANYPLPVSATPQLLTAALVWTLDIAGGTAAHFNGTAVLRDLALSVIDLANSGATVVMSQSTIDNSENAWIVIPAGGQYALRVARGSGSAFDYDYALAWQLLPDTDADGI